MSVDSAQKLEPAKAEIAFVGRSNVGKSSLLNALCHQHRLAKISKTPGKTRAINVFVVKPGKWIVDLPGYGFAKISEKEKNRWENMIEYYFSDRKDSLKAIFVLVDASIDATNLDRQMLVWLNSISMPYYVVANKIDRIPQSKLVTQRQTLAHDLKIAPEKIILTSAKKCIGIGELHAIAFDLLALS